MKKTLIWVRVLCSRWGIPSDYCDVTVVNSVLEYMPDDDARTRAVAEAVRITSAGGRAFFFDVRYGT